MSGVEISKILFRSELELVAEYKKLVIDRLVGTSIFLPLISTTTSTNLFLDCCFIYKLPIILLSDRRECQLMHSFPDIIIKSELSVKLNYYPDQVTLK